MKQSLRLDPLRLADSIRDKQLADPAALKRVLDDSQATGNLFTEAIVRSGLIADWELCRIAAEVFNLAFLPVESYEPDMSLIEAFDSSFLRENLLVPLDRFGNLLTVAMPCMVPNEVLQEIEKKLDVKVLPVIGSVGGNAAWLDENLPEARMLQALANEVESDEWGELFDVGDAAVQTGLQDDGLPAEDDDSLIVESVEGDQTAGDPSGAAPTHSGLEDELLSSLDIEEPGPPAEAPDTKSEDLPPVEESFDLDLDLDLDLPEQG